VTSWWTAVSFAATAISVAAKAGMLLQIRSNHQRKRVSGSSSVFFALGFGSYFASGLSGLQHMNLPLLVGQGLGVVPSAVIGWQIFLYKILPAHGYRMNDGGHFTGNTSCRTCRHMMKEEWQVEEHFPYLCPQDRVGGLLHLNFQPKLGQQIAACDQCNYSERKFLQGQVTAAPQPTW
jgi:hypothetical protein